MGKTKDYLDLLDKEVGIAPAGSQEELDCADTLAGVFSQHGLNPQVEEFSAPALGSLPYGVVMVLLFVGVLLAGIGGLGTTVVGLVLVALAVALLFMRYSGNDVLSKLGPRAHSQNVVALRESSVPKGERERPIVIVAHYDTPRTDLLSRAPLSMAKRYLGQFGPYLTIAVAVCALFQLLVFLPEGLRRVLWIVGLIASLPMLLWGVSLVAGRFMPYTTGAVDNKSSVAAMLGVLDHVCEGTLPRVRTERERELAAAQTEAAKAAVPADAETADVPSADAAVAAPAQPAAVQTSPARGPVVREEVEEVVGRRHGEQVLRALSILPESCDITYIEPEVRLVELEPEPEPGPAPAYETARERYERHEPVAEEPEEEPAEEAVDQAAIEARAAAVRAAAERIAAERIAAERAAAERARAEQLAEQEAARLAAEQLAAARRAATEQIAAASQAVSAQLAAGSAGDANVESEQAAGGQGAELAAVAVAAEGAEAAAEPAEAAAEHVEAVAEPASAAESAEVAVAPAAEPAESSVAQEASVPAPDSVSEQGEPVSSSYEGAEADVLPAASEGDFETAVADAEPELADEASEPYEQPAASGMYEPSAPSPYVDESLLAQGDSEAFADDYDDGVSFFTRAKSLFSALGVALKGEGNEPIDVYADADEIEEGIEPTPLVEPMQAIDGAEDELAADAETPEQPAAFDDESATVPVDAQYETLEQEPVADAEAEEDSTADASDAEADAEAAEVEQEPVQSEDAGPKAAESEAADTKIDDAPRGDAEPEPAEEEEPPVISAAAAVETEVGTAAPIGVISVSDLEVLSSTPSTPAQARPSVSSESRSSDQSGRSRGFFSWAKSRMSNMAGHLGQLEDGESTDEGPLIETDRSGLDAMVEEDANEASEAERPERPTPEAPDDPEWGKSSYSPKKDLGETRIQPRPELVDADEASEPSDSEDTIPMRRQTQEGETGRIESAEVHFASDRAAETNPQAVSPVAERQSVARRAVLFDLPDPLAADNDSLASAQAQAKEKRVPVSSRQLPTLEGDSATTAEMPRQRNVAERIATLDDPAPAPVRIEDGFDGSSAGSRSQSVSDGDIRVRHSTASRTQQAEQQAVPAAKSTDEHKKSRFGLFGRKSETEQESMSEWLGVEEDYNAKESGESIGSWDNFNEDSGRSRGRHWKGGAARSSELREAMAREQLAADADGAGPAPDEALPADDQLGNEALQQALASDGSMSVEVTEADLREAILSMDDGALGNHDVWFIATGASCLGHAGAAQFVEQHKRDLRGSFIINLECVGAGSLTMLTREGFGNVRRADRRCATLLSNVANDLHIPLGKHDRTWADTEATPIMRKSLRGVTVMGLGDDDLPAFSRTADDVPENVDAGQVEDVVALITEMIRRA